MSDKSEMRSVLSGPSLKKPDADSEGSVVLVSLNKKNADQLVELSFIIPHICTMLEVLAVALRLSSLAYNLYLCTILMV